MAAGPPGSLCQAWPPAGAPFFAPPLAPPPNSVGARKNFPLAGRDPSAAVIGTIIVLRDSSLRIISQMGLIGPIGLMGLTSPISPISPIGPISPIHDFHFCERGRRGSRSLFSTLPIREQALVDPQFAADPRHASRVLQNLQDGARFTLRGEKGRIEDRGSRIEDRLTRNDAILDPRSSILYLRRLRDLLGSEFPAQTLRLFVDGVLILRSQRPEEERPGYVNEREDYRARAEYVDRMRGGDQGPDGGRSDHRHDDGRRRVGDRRELSEVFPLHAELAADGGHAYRDVEHAKAGGSGGGPYKPAEFDAHVKRDAGERYLRHVEFEAEVHEIAHRPHDRRAN